MANNMMNGQRVQPQRMQSMNDPRAARGAPRNSGENNSSEASCKELMRAIMEADFVATDLKLYLDTHPDDSRALEMYREAVRQYKACKAAFEDTFYPLNATSAGRNGTWDWPDGTFPPLS